MVLRTGKETIIANAFGWMVSAIVAATSGTFDVRNNSEKAGKRKDASAAW